MMCDVKMIVAVDKMGGFGKNGEIPWNFPTDFKFFKDTTQGFPCIMGKNTYLDLIQIVSKIRTKDVDTKDTDLLDLGNPLPGREITVLTSDPNIPLHGDTKRTPSVQDFIYANSGKTVFVCGGERLYRESLSLANTIYLTAIEKDYKCDKFFPIELLDKNFTKHSIKQITEKGTKLYFLKYERKQTL